VGACWLAGWLPAGLVGFLEIVSAVLRVELSCSATLLATTDTRLSGIVIPDPFVPKENILQNGYTQEE
jgi:hypothetical protein